MEVNSYRNIYVFSKLPLDGPILDIYISPQAQPDERYESTLGNKYMKLYQIPNKSMNMILNIKYDENYYSKLIPNNLNFVFYLSKKRIPRIIKPPKTNSLKWLEEFESEDNNQGHNFEICYNFIMINNIFTKSFIKNCTSQFQSFLFEYRNLNFFSYNDISNYTFRIVNHYQSQVNNRESIPNFQLKFLHKISEDFLNHSLTTPFSTVSFLIMKQKVEIEPLRIDTPYNDSFNQFKELFYHSITTFGIPFIFWLYSSKFHNEIVKEYEKLEGQINRRNRNSSKLSNYAEIIQIIQLKFRIFDSFLNSGDFVLFLKFIEKFFNEQFTCQFLIDGLENIESEKLEFIKKFVQNKNLENLNRFVFSKNSFENDYFNAILNQYKGIPFKDDIKKSSVTAKSDGPVILMRKKMQQIKSKQRENFRSNLNDKLNDKMVEHIENEKNYYQLSLLERHAASFIPEIFDIPQVLPKKVSKSDEIVIKKRKKIILSNQNTQFNSDSSTNSFYRSSSNTNSNNSNNFIFNSNNSSSDAGNFMFNNNSNNNLMFNSNNNNNSNSNLMFNSNNNNNSNNFMFNSNNNSNMFNSNNYSNNNFMLNSNNNLNNFALNNNSASNSNNFLNNIQNNSNPNNLNNPSNSFLNAIHQNSPNSSQEQKRNEQKQQKSDGIVIQFRKPRNKLNNDSNDTNNSTTESSVSTNVQVSQNKTGSSKVSVQTVTKSDGIVIQKRSKPSLNIQIGSPNKK